MAVTRSITVIGGDLFHIALTQLGDARQAVRLAKINNISDWFLPDDVITTLLVPPVDQAAISGIPEQ